MTTNLPIHSTAAPIWIATTEGAGQGATLAEALHALEHRASWYGEHLTDATEVLVKCGERRHHVTLGEVRQKCRPARAESSGNP